VAVKTVCTPAALLWLLFRGRWRKGEGIRRRRKTAYK